VFDMISAKIADGMGFECLYGTGFGTVASHLGLPDARLATSPTWSRAWARWRAGCGRR
jgi:2-methylisocitrate lyase-like PEP mutase family enzyme